MSGYYRSRGSYQVTNGDSTARSQTAVVERTRKKNVLRHLPDVLDEPESGVGEDFVWNLAMEGSSGDSSVDSDLDAASGDNLKTTAAQAKVLSRACRGACLEPSPLPLTIFVPPPEVDRTDSAMFH